MENKKLVRFSLAHSLGVLAYIALVAAFMQNAEKIFGKADKPIGTVTFLLLFVMSATIVGGLVVVKPVMLYLDGDKKSAVKMFIYTAGWLFLWLVLVVLVALIWK